MSPQYHQLAHSLPPPPLLLRRASIEAMKNFQNKQPQNVLGAADGVRSYWHRYCCICCRSASRCSGVRFVGKRTSNSMRMSPYLPGSCARARQRRGRREVRRGGRRREGSPYHSIARGARRSLSRPARAFAIGIPSPFSTFTIPGWIISSTCTRSCRPSSVGSTSAKRPLSACSSVMGRRWTRSFPSRRYVSWGFSSTTKTMSAGMAPGFSSPCG